MKRPIDIFLKLCLIFFFIPVIAYANPSDENITIMKIGLSDNSILEIPVDESMVITMPDIENSGTPIVITTADKKYDILLDNTDRISYEVRPTSAISDITTDSPDKWRLDGDNLILDVASDKCIFAIYSINGITMISRIFKTGTHTVSISELNTGIYILQLNGSSTKFIKR